MSKRTKESRKRVNSLVLLIAFTAILLIASTYAWFNTQKNVSLSNLTARVEVAEGLQISLDGYEWSQAFNFGGSSLESASWEEYDEGVNTHDKAGTVSNNVRPKISGATDSINATGYLVPMSTSGILPSSDSYYEVPFYAGSMAGESKATKITEAVGGKINNATSYYAFDVFLMDTSKDTSGSTTLQLGFPSMVEAISSTDTYDYGLQNAIRVAFATYATTADISANQNAVVEGTENSVSGQKIDQVAVWEPNYDVHAPYVVEQNSKLKGLIDAAGESTNVLNTYGFKTVTDSTAERSIEDVYNYTDANITAMNSYINQTSGGTFDHCVLNGEKEQKGNSTGTINLKNTSATDFTISKNKITKMRIYVWLEGEDPDCVNWASHSTGVSVDINLAKDANITGTSTVYTYDNDNDADTVEIGIPAKYVLDQGTGEVTP